MPQDDQHTWGGSYKKVREMTDSDSSKPRDMARGVGAAAAEGAVRRIANQSTVSERGGGRKTVRGKRHSGRK